MEAFRQWLTENSYARQTELSFAHCDRNRRVRPASLLSMFAAAAGYDYDARGLTYEKLYAMREVFLISRVAFRVHRCPVNRDILTVSTWEDGVRGAHMRRVYEITDGAGTLCVSARSEWIMVDPLERRILRPAGFTGKTITVCPKKIDCPDCCKVLAPKEGLEALGQRTVRWSDLDGNGHVYSGNYADIAWDALPPELQDAPLREFYINYSHEATLGDTLELFGVQTADGYLVEGRTGAEISFTCRCIFEASRTDGHE